MMSMIIAIAGASASGKTLFVDNLIAKLSKQLEAGSVCRLQEDAYYKDQTDLAFSERESVNYDHPSAFDHALLCEHLQSLSSGVTVEQPVYDFARHTRAAHTETVTAGKVILIDGILLLADRELRDLFDIKLFVDTPLDICLARRIKRDVDERGRTLDSVLTQFEQTVRPMYFEYVSPSRVHADVVVNRGGMNQIAVDMVMQTILNELA
ncbi:MAG: uridine kinase [Pseudomonadota bacterium]